MGRRRANNAVVALRTVTSVCSRSTALSNPSSRRGLHCSQIRSSLIASSRPATPLRQQPHGSHNGHSLALAQSTENRRRYSTRIAEGTRIAVAGGGLTGLTTAYYLAKELPASAKVTVYEGSDRLGGWVKTDQVSVDVGGVQGTVSFERGPRTLSSLNTSTWRYDDLVLYDLVRYG